VHPAHLPPAQGTLWHAAVLLICTDFSWKKNPDEQGKGVLLRCGLRGPGTLGTLSAPTDQKSLEEAVYQALQLLPRVSLSAAPMSSLSHSPTALHL